MQTRDECGKGQYPITQNKTRRCPTTIVGGRTGRKVAEIVARHPMVKRIIPSVISVNELLVEKP